MITNYEWIRVFILKREKEKEKKRVSENMFFNLGNIQYCFRITLTDFNDIIKVF